MEFTQQMWKRLLGHEKLEQQNRQIKLPQNRGKGEFSLARASSAPKFVP